MTEGGSELFGLRDRLEALRDANMSGEVTFGDDGIISLPFSPEKDIDAICDLVRELIVQSGDDDVSVKVTPDLLDN